MPKALLRINVLQHLHQIHAERKIVSVSLVYFKQNFVRALRRRSCQFGKINYGYAPTHTISGKMD